MRLTRTGASSSARAAANGGSAAVAAEDDPEPVADAPAAGAAHEQQRAAGPHLADRVARDLERLHDVLAERLRALASASISSSGP